MTASPAAHPLQLEIIADVICPWCFIGKRKLDAALKILSANGLDFDVIWSPYQLNPTMPAEGMDRKEFRSKRFGSWENSMTMDARAATAGREIGMDFQYGQITRSPSTLLSHALIRTARTEGGSAVQHAVVEAIFTAYFTDGLDIGNADVLRRIGRDHGLTDDAMDHGFADLEPVRAADEWARNAGFNGVPSYRLNGQFLVSGSMDTARYVQMLTAAAEHFATANAA